MGHIAIIPARAGSKSIINKNLKRLGPFSLVDIAIRAAVQSKIFNRIILSTDIETLIEEHQKSTMVTLDVRPDHLAEDSTLMSDVLSYVIKSQSISALDYVWILQPTTPFRLPCHFTEILEMVTAGAQAVISVTEMGAYHRDRCYTMKNHFLYPQRHTNFKNKQDLHSSFIRNGAFYVIRVAEFLATQSFFVKGQKTYGYKMADLYSVNVDSLKDLIMARALYHAYENELASKVPMERMLT